MSDARRQKWRAKRQKDYESSIPDDIELELEYAQEVFDGGGNVYIWQYHHRVNPVVAASVVSRIIDIGWELFSTDAHQAKVLEERWYTFVRPKGGQG